MSYSFNVKGKFKVEPELVREVIDLLKEIEIEYERPKKSVFEIDDDGVVEESELNGIIEVFEHIFEYIVSDLDQSIFIYIHELDPVDREVIISENHLDLMTQSDSPTTILFLEKGIMKNSLKVIREINSIKSDIINGLIKNKFQAKWMDINEVNNPFILQNNFKIKVKGGNKGIFISSLLDEDLHCENYEEVYDLNNEELKEKFNEGYIGIKISLRAFYTDLEKEAMNIIIDVFKEKFDIIHTKVLIKD